MSRNICTSSISSPQIAFEDYLQEVTARLLKTRILHQNLGIEKQEIMAVYKSNMESSSEGRGDSYK